ncbi:hypothetical protein J2W28_006445 [Variovorax boronicumulans]|uniref:hypothetical protein n=1 Tax=Variovorax boronicumulans TaxID=436515 RepID=UPI002781CEC2|nr:hypothetical protein [Variovorax boronicumulans]MDP9995487.1 hypothetical protein [Variovorax boronicumulans]MDQ0007270.1 hypothetical protein [Variovorax boronicumulans]
MIQRIDFSPTHAQLWVNWSDGSWPAFEVLVDVGAQHVEVLAWPPGERRVAAARRITD